MEFKFITVMDYCSIQNAEPKHWLWESLVPEREITTIFGAPGSGKSALALGLAIHSSCGQPNFLGLPLAKCSRILWLDAEMDEAILKFRGSLVEASLGISVSPEAVHYCKLPMPLHSNGLKSAAGKEVEALIKTLQPELLVIDSYGYAFAPKAEADAYSAIEAVRWLKALDTTVVLIEHEAKHGKGKTKTPYGSVFKMAGARSLLSLTKTDSHLTLRQTKSNFGPSDQEIEVEFDPEQMLFGKAGGSSGSASGTAQGLILGQVAEGKKTLEELCEAIPSKKPKSIQNAVNILQGKGKIVKQGDAYGLALLN